MPDSSRLNSVAQQWHALPWSDRRQLLAMVLLLPLIDLLLRVAGLRRTQRLLGLDDTSGVALLPVSAASIAEGQRLARLANVAGRRGVYTTTCLRQALAVQWWLRRRQLPAELRIGARTESGILHAHAWVVLGDIALGQTNELPPIIHASPDHA
ncbi:MAG: hypothetical protein JWL98_109 [Xanthomonadaceae bacterium]|nr:hypothetical protein [Xanthomonadaceae bacterium]